VIPSAPAAAVLLPGLRRGHPRSRVARALEGWSRRSILIRDGDGVATPGRAGSRGRGTLRAVRRCMRPASETDQRVARLRSEAPGCCRARVRHQQPRASAAQPRLALAHSARQGGGRTPGGTDRTSQADSPHRSPPSTLTDTESAMARGHRPRGSSTRSQRSQQSLQERRTVPRPGVRPPPWERWARASRG